MASPWNERWGLRGRVARRFFLAALAAFALARCEGDDGAWCCCCEGGIPYLTDWIQPEHEEIERAAVSYAEESAALSEEVGGVSEALVLRTHIGAPRLQCAETAGGAPLCIATVRVEGPRGEVTASVYLVERDDAWTGVAARFRRGEEWVAEGEVPRRDADEIADAAREYASSAPEVAARVGAAPRAEITLDERGDPAPREERGREGGTAYVVTVTVTGASGSVALEVWVQRAGERFEARGASGDLELGALPPVRPESTSGGGSSGSSFDWD
ncbi:MAG: hypothetical protein M5U09_17590 [Gammaproteobacteria bacterium]|nr:hypothetical protein [Gammaproteobacteria bacterium]